MLAVLVLGACGGSSHRARPSRETATYEGLTVELQLDRPTVVLGKKTVVGYFVVSNPTKDAVSLEGCQFGQFTFGLVPVSQPDAPLQGDVTTSCASGTTTFAPGAHQKWFAAQFVTTNGTTDLPPGEYVAVVRFNDTTEVRAPLTLT